MHDAEQRGRAALPRGRAALRPQRRAPHRRFDLAAARRQLDADVEHHRDIDAERFLKADHVLGREAVRAAVEVRAKRDAVVVEVAPRFQAEDLEAAAVGEDRPVPGHEAMQAAQRDERLASRAQPQMVGVRENDLRADLAQVGRRDALHGGGGSDRHEGRRLDGAVRERQRAAAGRAVDGVNGERGHRAQGVERGRDTPAAAAASNVSMLFGHRMLEREPPGMQRLARQRRARIELAVDRIVEDRKPERREVHANLMRAARLEASASTRRHP